MKNVYKFVKPAGSVVLTGFNFIFLCLCGDRIM